LRLAAKGLEYPPSVARLVRRIGRLDPDVVHVQWLPRPEHDLRWLRRVADDRPVVFTAHDVLPRRRAAFRVWPDVLETAERVVVHSQRAVDQLVELGLGRERIARIAHPVFAAEPLPSPKGRTLLFFGLIRDYKGLDVLLEALPQIPDAKLVVAGDPVDPVRKSPGVDWRLGFVPEREVPSLMAEAAAVVLPYRRLDSSGVLATAIGYGRPVVVSDVGSLGEIVREYGAGEVVPPGEAHGLAEACTRLLEPAALKAAHAGAKKAARQLTWKRAAQAHDKLYREVRR
jgi:glycosyltransferase involved in cell wall biosynthesis